MSVKNALQAKVMYFSVVLIYAALLCGLKSDKKSSGLCNHTLWGDPLGTEWFQKFCDCNMKHVLMQACVTLLG